MFFVVCVCVYVCVCLCTCVCIYCRPSLSPSSFVRPLRLFTNQSHHASLSLNPQLPHPHALFPTPCPHTPTHHLPPQHPTSHYPPHSFPTLTPPTTPTPTLPTHSPGREMSAPSSGAWAWWGVAGERQPPQAPPGAGEPRDTLEAAGRRG